MSSSGTTIIAATSDHNPDGTVLGWQKLFNKVVGKIDNVKIFHTIMDEYTKGSLPKYNELYVKRLPSAISILDPACPKEVKPRETPKTSPVSTPKGTPQVREVKKIASSRSIVSLKDSSCPPSAGAAASVRSPALPRKALTLT